MQTSPNSCDRSSFAAILPIHDQPDVVKNQRSLELQQRQESYNWGSQEVFQYLPGYLQASTHTDIPRDSRFSDKAENVIKEEKQTMNKVLRLAYISTFFDNWKNFDNFQNILDRAYGGVPKIVEHDRWMVDKVFGSMFLNGCNPNTIQRCEKLPSNFPVTEDMVKSFLDRGRTLKEEMQVTEFY